MAGFSVQELTELLSGPFGSWMISHIAVQNSSRPDLDRDKDVQGLKRRSHRGEEIASDNGACMIVNERCPPLTAWLPRTPTLFQVLAHSARIDQQAQFEGQLVGDPSFSPAGILLRHRRDE